MKIQIKFNEEKAKRNGYTLAELYKITDDICENRKLSKDSTGSYFGTISVSQMFLATDDIERVNGLVDSADEWYWWVDSDDDKDKEDLLAIRTHMINAGKGHLLNA